MKQAKDYVREDGPGRQTVTSLAYWLTPEGLCNPIAAALLRDALQSMSEVEFSEAFDGATKGDAAQYLAAYELCAMPFWGADELARAIHDADDGRDESLAKSAVSLAQKAGELPEAFKPRRGIEWAMSRGYLFGDHAALVGAPRGTYGHPHGPPLNTEDMPDDGPPDFPDAPLRLDASSNAMRIPPASAGGGLKRRDLLTPLIEAAQREAQGARDAPAVFSVMRTWATNKPPRPPLVGVTTTGIKWLDSNDAPKEFSLKNLRDRLRARKSSS